LSKFSKYRKKSKWSPKEGSLVLINANGCLMEVGSIKDVDGEKKVFLDMNCGDIRLGVEMVPIRHLIQKVRVGEWKIVKDGPIEPEKILKQYKFI
jgi:hypothetical protein